MKTVKRANAAVERDAEIIARKSRERSPSTDQPPIEAARAPEPRADAATSKEAIPPDDAWLPDGEPDEIARHIMHDTPRGLSLNYYAKLITLAIRRERTDPIKPLVYPRPFAELSEDITRLRFSNQILRRALVKMVDLKLPITSRIAKKALIAADSSAPESAPPTATTSPTTTGKANEDRSR